MTVDLSVESSSVGSLGSGVSRDYAAGIVPGLERGDGGGIGPLIGSHIAAVQSQERIFYMDSARSILMMLGVVVHASNVYRESGNWIVNDAPGHWVFNLLGDLVHLFRMPAFFIISGFFCALTLKKYGFWTFVKKRMPRIVIPLVAVAVLINLPQTILTNGLGLTESDLSLAGTLGGDSLIYHLWFLVNLVLYFLAAAAIYPTLKLVYLPDWLQRKWPSNGSQQQVLILILAVAISCAAYLGLLAAASVWPILYAKIGFVGRGFSLAYYFIFFCFGIAMYEIPKVREAFFSKGWLMWPVVLSLYGLSQVAQPNSAYGSVVDSAFRFIGTLAAVHLTLWVFWKFFDQPSRMSLYLSDASYSVYLFHHVVVVALAILLLGVEVSLGVKFSLLCGASLVISLLVHEFLVSRSAVLRCVFNGRCGP